MECFSKGWILILILSLGLFLTACSSGESANHASDGKIKIVTTIAQIAEPLQVIGGDLVEVNSLMGPSVDPHLYNATHGDITKIADAELVFYNGLNLEANMVGIFEEMKAAKPVVAVGEAVPEELLLKDEKGSIDPHIWFDLELWKLALDEAVKELQKYAPERSDVLAKNKEAYFAKVDDLSEESKKLSEIPVEHRYLVTAHDAFGYFGRMHDLEVIGLQGLSTDSEIGVSDIRSTIEIIKQYNVPAVFVESSINESSIKAVIEGAREEGVDVELGGQLYSDAMGKAGTEEGTYLGMYRHNVKTIYEALMGGVN